MVDVLSPRGVLVLPMARWPVGTMARFRVCI
jgi:hypothetical protein